jgi:hypothetical protein
MLASFQPGENKKPTVPEIVQVKAVGRGFFAIPSPPHHNADERAGEPDDFAQVSSVCLSL